MSWPTFVVATLIIGTGAFLQGTVGFGMGLFSAPLLALIDHRFVPGPVVAASILLTLLMTRREWSDIRRADLGWSLGGRVGGIVLAVAVLDRVSTDGTDLLLGGLVLGAVVISGLGLSVQLRPRNLLGAGVVSGFMATTSSVGGPPMALLYQHEAGPSIRATLSAYFLLGGLLTLVGLALGGHLGRPEAIDAVALFPGVLIGYQASHRAMAAVSRTLLRRLILIVCAGSASVLILRQLL